jgi:hypothetical protein
MPIVQPRHHAGDRHEAKAANPRDPRRRALARAGFRTLMAVTVLGLVPIALTTPPGSGRHDLYRRHLRGRQQRRH